MTPEVVATLRATQIFAPLDDAELSAIASRAVVKPYRAGTLLFSEGDPCSGLFLVLSGKVRIFKTSRSGREQVLSIEGAQASIAELPVFDGGVYPASAAAVEDSRMLFLSRADFQRACIDNPHLALKVLQVVGGRLRRLVGIIEQLSFTTLRHRLISWLLKQAKEQGRVTPTGVVFEAGVTHQEIAAHIGTVRELVSRNMARLQAQGLIESNGREMRIPDLRALEDELSEGES